MEKKTLTEAQEFNDKQFTKRIIFRQGNNTVFVLNFMPGQQLPAHKHPGSAVYLMVLQGRGTLIIDGQQTEIAEKDAIFANGDEELAFMNNSSKNVSLYVILTKIPDERYAQNI